MTYTGIIPASSDVRFTILHGWLGLYEYLDVNINEIALFTTTTTKQRVVERSTCK